MTLFGRWLYGRGERPALVATVLIRAVRFPDPRFARPQDVGGAIFPWRLRWWFCAPLLPHIVAIALGHLLPKRVWFLRLTIARELVSGVKA